MSVGTTVAHARRKNRHWSISGPEAVPELAGRSGSSGAGDTRKRRGLGSLAVTKSGIAQPSGIARELSIESQALQERLGHGVDGGDPGARVQAADGDVDHQQRGVRLAEALLVVGVVREVLGRRVAERRGLEQGERGGGAGRRDDVLSQHAAEVPIGRVVHAGGRDVGRRMAREQRDLVVGVLGGLRVLAVVQRHAADHDRGEAVPARLLHRLADPPGLRSVGPAREPARGVVDGDDPDGARGRLDVERERAPRLAGDRRPRAA